VKTDRIDRPLVTVPAVRRPGWGRRFGVLIAILAIATCALYVLARQYVPQALQLQGAAGARGGRNAQRAADAPVPVLVAAARKEDVPVYFDGVGTSRALNTVTVRAQVDGKLMSVNFKEGQDVDQDFVLADIDPTIYRAQYDQAVAKKAMDEALLGNARIDLERYARLVATNSATRQQYDTQKALVAQLEAQVQADQGAIENAKAMLSYTRIVAPIAGRTGLRLVDAGNIVHAIDTTGIVVITQIKPIAVIFTLPQQQLAEVNRTFAQGTLTVNALGDDNRSVVDRGKLVVVDNQVDQTTGTVKLKAEFPNEGLQLWPGQFINVKLLVNTLKDAIVVPTAAVQRGPNGTFVYIAKDDDTVLVRPVTVSQQDDTEAVLVSGASEGERVVTTGFASLNDGTRISIGTQENLQRPAGSERRRRGPISPAPTAQSDQKPTPEPAQAQQEPRRDGTAAATEKPSPPAAKTGETPHATAPATAGERPRNSAQRRSETRSPTASP
jgi:multidrug efflux system membrane fusion protein